MKIVQFQTPGPPSVLDYIDVPTPEPKEGEVLVRAHAIGIGMPDVMIRRGVYNWMPPLPAAPGTEMSGIVERLGPGVTRFKVGQRVVVSARDRPHRGGCYAEYNATPENSVYALPDGADMDQAAALANYQVAYHLLYDCITFKPGQSVLVQGAAGGTGSALLDLAQSAGLKVIGLCSGQAKIEFAKSFGVEHVIDRQRDDVGEGVKAATQGRGVDFIMDFAGGPDFAKNFAMLAPYGTVVSYGQLAGKPPGDIYAALRAQAAKNLALRVFSIHIYDHWREPMQAGMRWLIERLGRGEIRPRIHDRLPLAEARRAHELFESGQVMGKLLLLP
ncbi:MAG TPA: zinc-dependent alcohol dehydrogenase family protein [Stellaceae bacterium]|jgi:NADPH2:quinone reductase|nr:zinc-dependent alcohol dehydrogenase family protein [Stellaceae bacterium]